jgi:hypothetical protein
MSITVLILSLLSYQWIRLLQLSELGFNIFWIGGIMLFVISITGVMIVYFRGHYYGKMTDYDVHLIWECNIHIITISCLINMIKIFTLLFHLEKKIEKIMSVVWVFTAIFEHVCSKCLIAFF